MPFNAYISHTNAQYEEVERLGIHLQELRKSLGLKIFSRFDLQPGDDVEKMIEAKLENASIIFCLVNADYLQECKNEIQKIEKFYQSKTKRIIPIILGKCLLDFSFFRRLQPISLTRTEKSNSETLWYKVAEYLSAYIQENSQVEPNMSDFTIAPYTAAAGRNCEYGQLKIVPATTIKLRNYQKGDLLFEIEGNSMSTYVNDGDYVHARKCEKAKEVINDKIYIIETRTDGIMIKKIQDKGNILILKSINKEYKDFEIDKNGILALWTIVNKININAA